MIVIGKKLTTAEMPQNAAKTASNHSDEEILAKEPKAVKTGGRGRKKAI